MKMDWLIDLLDSRICWSLWNVTKFKYTAAHKINNTFNIYYKERRQICEVIDLICLNDNYNLKAPSYREVSENITV